MSIALHACFFDASALAKVYVTESHSYEVRAFWQAQHTKYTTPFCFHETLTVIKLKWLRKEITKDIYLDAVTRATHWYRVATRNMDNPDITDTEVFVAAFELVSKYDLDFSDACQIVSVSKGYFSHNAMGSKTVFVTADGDLVKAARNEGLRVWHVGKELALSLYDEEASPPSTGVS
jgi:predicted nucleic acid-binding protein